MPSSGEMADFVGKTRSGVMGLGATVLPLVTTSFSGFPATDLVAAVDFSFVILGLAVFLVTVTLGCVGAAVTG